MSNSKFSFAIWDNETGVLHPNSLRLSIVGDIMSTMLDRDRPEDACQCRRCSESLDYNYYEDFIKILNGCEIQTSLPQAKIEVLKAINDIKLCGMRVKEQFDKPDYPRATTSELEEMKEFFGNIAKHYINDYKESIEDVVAVKNERHERFTLKSLFSLEGRNWEFYLPVVDGEASVGLKIDNNEIEEIEHYSTSCIVVLLQMVATCALARQGERMAGERIIKDASNKAVLMSRSKAMASVFGGSYLNYLDITGFILMKKEQGSDLLEKEALTGFMMREFRSDITIVKEAVKIFLEKPMYH